MYPIPFRSLMNWVVTEYADCGEIFGIHKAYRASGKSLPIFGERIETSLRPRRRPQQPAGSEHHRRLCGRRTVLSRSRPSRRWTAPIWPPASPAPAFWPTTRATIRSGPRSDGAAGHGRVHQGLVRPEGSQQGLRSGRSRRLRVQYVRRLRSGGHQGREGEHLYRRHDGRPPYRHLR